MTNKRLLELITTAAISAIIAAIVARAIDKRQQPGGY